MNTSITNPTSHSGKDGSSTSKRSSRRQRVALLLAAAGMLATPALAAGGSSVSAGEDARTGEITTDVKIVAEQFGWDVDSAAQHLAAQADFGQLINRLAVKYRSVFAGAEFAEKPGATSFVMVKGRTPSGIARLVKASGQQIEIISGLRYSEVEQKSRSTQIVNALVKQGHDDVVTAILPHGEIQVSVAPGLPAKLPRLLRDGVNVATAPDTVSVDEVALGGQQVYGGGFQCTSGFSVRRISDGTTGMSTAAHCTGMNMINVVGPDQSMSFQGQHDGAFGDMEWHTTADVEIDNYMASPTDERDVSMVWPSNGYATNMVTCVHSRMQGTRSCDQIYSTSVSSSGSSSLIATDNDSTVGGDSGGPWSFNTIADGIHKGDKWIWFGTRNVFSRAALLPTALGVEVMT